MRSNCELVNPFFGLSSRYAETRDIRSKVRESLLYSNNMREENGEPGHKIKILGCEYGDLRGVSRIQIDS